MVCVERLLTSDYRVQRISLRILEALSCGAQVCLLLIKVLCLDDIPLSSSATSARWANVGLADSNVTFACGASFLCSNVQTPTHIRCSTEHFNHYYNQNTEQLTTFKMSQYSKSNRTSL